MKNIFSLLKQDLNFWAAIWLAGTIVITSSIIIDCEESVGYAIFMAIVNITTIVLCAIISIGLLIPRFVRGWNKVFIPPIYFGIIYLMYVLVSVIKKMTVGPNHSLTAIFLPSRILDVVDLAVNCIPVISLALMREYYMAVKRILEIKKEQTITETNILSSQISPHFFFNTLHNLYGLSLNQPAATQDYIERFQKIAQYVVSTHHTTYVTLQSELEFIKSYIELEKLRINDMETIIFKNNIPVDALQIKIIPMILAILVENAFKHGSKCKNEVYFIEIKAEWRAPHTLLFNVRNNNCKHMPPPKNNGGLFHLEKRLNLLYKNTHTFTTQSNPDAFECNLEIKLF